jgi:hypothetical protein
MKIKSIHVITLSFLLVINSISISATNYRDKEPINPCQEFYEDIVDMIQLIDENLVYSYLEKLVSIGPRYTGTENCKAAADFIYSEFENMSLDVEFHDWKFDKFKSRNVVATLKGYDSSSNATIIISAHYDTVKDSLGANDDGSGVAVVLAIAKILSNYSFRQNICFIAFSGEEVGTYGSFTYARDAYFKKENIYAVLNLDIVGWAETDYGGKIIRFSHTVRSSWIAEFAINISEKYMDIIDLTVEDIPNYRGADHQAFLDYGYDAVWIVEHDPCRNCNQPDDNLTNVNSTYLAKVTKLLLAVLGEMAFKPIDIQVILKTPYEGRGYLFNRSIIPLDLGKFYFWGLRGVTVILGRANVSCKVITEEEVKFVIFCIDDIFLTWDSKPPYEWKIQGRHKPLIGRHNLKVYAYTISGKRASDEMDIIIFTLSNQYGRW